MQRVRTLPSGDLKSVLEFRFVAQHQIFERIEGSLRAPLRRCWGHQRCSCLYISTQDGIGAIKS
jgi:hypothetical protein